MAIIFNPFDGIAAQHPDYSEEFAKLNSIYYNQTTVKISDYTATDLDSIPCDTSGGTFTITLPDSGKVRIFDTVGIDNKSGFTLNPLIVKAPIGKTVMGANTYKLFVGGTHADFGIIDNDWRLIDISYSNQPVSADNVYWVDPNGDDNNSGKLPSNPVKTIKRALELIEEYAAANGITGDSNDCIKLRAGVYVEEAPLVVRRGVAIMADSLRVTEVRPTENTKTNNLFLVDSAVKFWGITFAGHQTGSFAISFNPNADNTAIGASDLGAYILKSPYIQNCTSYTAQDDDGLAGSVSQGTTGGGLEVDGAKCATNSPIRSMVVDSFTQVNLNGPGCLVKNDGYAQLVSFFATFCEYHVKTETGGQVNLSGGGTTDFGTYGLVANGYSPSPLFVGEARQDEKSSVYIQNTVTIDLDNNNFVVINSLPLDLKDGDLIKFAPTGTLQLEQVGLESDITYYVINADDLSTPKTFQVSEEEGGIAVTLINPTSADLTEETFEYRTQGVTEIDIINFTNSRLGTVPGSISRPTAGQLMFPQLVFPRDEQTKTPISKTFNYTRIADNKLIYTEEVSTIPHEYVDGGTVIIDTITYSVVNSVYNNETGEVEIEVDGTIPSETGTAEVQGLNFICPTSAYVVTGSIPIDQNGNPSTENIAGYRVNFFSSTSRYLKNDIKAGQVIDFRNRSQISAPSHTFEFVGSGTNYAALPFNGGVPNPANKIVEENNGRVYSSNTDERGNFAVGAQFSVDGTSGSVTINTDQFNLSGLNAIGPFSRSGIDSVGVQLKEVSNNVNLISSTGAPDGNTTPTQFAVKTYLENEYTPLTRGIDTGTGLTGGGDLSTNRTLALNQSSINSLSLADTALQDEDIGETVQGYDANTVIDANYVATENSYTTTDKNKLAGIEEGATADQTGEEIKALYEAELNTNAFTDEEKTKLTGIEAGATADQTGEEIKALYEAELDTNAFTDEEKTKLASLYYAPTDVKTEDYLAVDRDAVYCDTRERPFSVTLPTDGSVQIFDVVGVDADTGFGVNNLVVLPNAGQTILGETSLYIDIGATKVVFSLFGTDWKIADISAPQFVLTEWSEITNKPDLSIYMSNLIYDPGGKSADVFDLSNHTGSIDGGVFT